MADDSLVNIEITQDRDIHESRLASGAKGKLAPRGDNVTYFSLYRFSSDSDRLYLAIGFVGAVIHGAGMPAFSFIFGNLINSFTDPTTNIMDEIEKMALALLILAAITMVASAVWNAVFTYTAVTQVTRCRSSCMSKLLRKDIGWFDQHSPAELPSRLQENVSKIQTAISYKAGLFVMNISMFITGYVIAAVRGWQIFLIILSVVPIIAGASAYMGKSLAKHSRLASEYYAKAGAIAEEALNSIRTVTAFNGRSFELGRYDKACTHAKEGGIKGSTAGGISLGVVMGSIFLTYAMAFYFGGYMIEHNVYNPYSGANYQAGDIMTIIFSVIMGTFALGQAAPCLQAFAEGIAAGRDLFGLVGDLEGCQIEGAVGGDHQLLPVPTAIQKISAQNVFFKYPSRPEVAVLEDVSLEILAGQKVAFVGESGSGKSTIVGLLERFYDPLGGSLKINGVDLRSFDVTDLRSQFGYVGQEPILFASSIRDNLVYGHPDAKSISDQTLMDACRRANVWEFLQSLPSGLSTYVGPGGGTQISGGQKQRIAIARALLRNPQVLLLDEATSALDNDSEKQVQQTIDLLQTTSTLTTISIAHRLSTIQNSDQIFVFRKGQLVEQGKHDALMQKEGLYHVLVATQAAAAVASSSKKISSPIARDPSRRFSLAAVRHMSSTLGVEVLAGLGEVGLETDADEDARRIAVAKNFSVPWKRVIDINGDCKQWYLPAILGSCGNGVSLPLHAYFISRCLGAFELTNMSAMMETLSEYSLAYVGLAVGTGLSIFAQWASFGILAESFTKSVRVLIFGKLLAMDIGFFDDPQNAPGKLCDTLSSNAMKMSALSGQVIGSFMQIAAALVAGIIISFCGSVKLAAVMTATMPLLIFSAGIHMAVMVGVQKNSDWEKAMKQAALIVSEALQNIRTLRAFTARDWTLTQYKTCVEIPLGSALKDAVIGGLLYGFSNMVPFLCYAGGFYYGGWLVVNEGLSFETMIQSLMAIILASTGAGHATAFLPDLVHAKAAAHDVFQLLDTETLTAGLGCVPTEKPNLIEFRNVKFAYPSRPGVQVLSGLSFTVRAGQKIALVGPSGGGKSTVMALLQRFYEPTEGALLVNHTELQSIDVQWWRDQIGYVGQEPVLFDLTLEENLRYGNSEVSHNQIEIVAQKANMDFVGSVQWADRLGPKGSLLSGGQKQRTAIARALLRDPPILMLDEATSALDSASEAQVQKALDAAQDGRTTFTIAHRLSTIQDYDVILVIAGGVLVESGSHEELMNKQTVYYELYMKGQQVT